MTEKTETAYFAGGCFWCTEAIFSELKGVHSVVPGYSGGKSDDPSYDEVSSGTTNHAEAIKIEFDPSVISYETLLEVFFATHDPTTVNRQGADVGTQYRSAVFTTDDTQKETAKEMIARTEKELGKDVVTEVAPFTEFFEAEDYHHDYYKNNESAPYCQIVISPKLTKLREKFARLTK